MKRRGVFPHQLPRLVERCVIVDLDRHVCNGH